MGIKLGQYSFNRENVYQKLETAFDQILKHLRFVKIPYSVHIAFPFLYSLLGVGKCGQTWSFVVDVLRGTQCYFGVCKLLFPYCLFLCSELTSADEQASNELMSCKNQCPKNLAACGHRCSSNCHSGPCPSPELCNRKSAVRCPCRRKKRVSPYLQFYSKATSQHWDIVLICG